MTTKPADSYAANGRAKITRAAVLAAALEIIDRDGAEALSMRRLARALDRDPMILYRHAPDRAALIVTRPLATPLRLRPLVLCRVRLVAPVAGGPAVSWSC